MKRTAILLATAAVTARACFVAYNGLNYLRTHNYDIYDGNIALSKGLYALINWLCFIAAILLLSIFRPLSGKARLYNIVVYSMLLLSIFVFFSNYFLFFS